MELESPAFELPSILPDDLSQLLSPSLVWFRDRIERNIEQMVLMVRQPDRLRPHCKTHKSADIVRLLLKHGIKRHKAATIAEVQMLAESGVQEIVLAYPPVGPTVTRIEQLLLEFPDVSLAVTIDCQRSLELLSNQLQFSKKPLGVMLDVNVGQNRTGVSVGDDFAVDLCRQIKQLPGVQFAGMQVYDGHLRESDPDVRSQIVDQNWKQVQHLKGKLQAAGLTIPEILCGGTPTFPMYAAMSDPNVRCSPGTCVLHDAGYGRAFRDLPFEPAAAVVTRVISQPAQNLLTLDVGNKSIAADPALERRAFLPQIPDAQIVGHNEEHMVVQTVSADRFPVGSVLLAIPGHVCPTSALHEEAVIVDAGRIVDRWKITARNRSIGI